MVCGVAFREELFLPFADLLEAALLPDFVLVLVVLELGLVLEEVPDFEDVEGLLFEDVF